MGENAHQQEFFTLLNPPVPDQGKRQASGHCERSGMSGEEQGLISRNWAAFNSILLRSRLSVSTQHCLFEHIVLCVCLCLCALFEERQFSLLIGTVHCLPTVGSLETSVCVQSTKTKP